MRTTITRCTLFAFLLFAICRCADTKRHQRQLENLQDMNGYLHVAFIDKLKSARKTIQEELEIGNRKHVPIQEMFEKLDFLTKSQLATLDRVSEPGFPSDQIGDSIRFLSNKSAAFDTAFIAEYPDFKKWHRDSEAQNPYQNFLSFADLGSREYLAMDLTVLRSEIIQHAMDQLNWLNDRMRSFVCPGPDTLSTYALPNAETIDAGDDLLVRIGVIKQPDFVFAEFEGDGTVQTTYDRTSATLLIKTSEDMIPLGEQSTSLKYKAKIKVARPDGEMSIYPVAGQVKVRRPCSSDI